jgi:kumamolisin
MKVLFSLAMPQAAQSELEQRVSRGELVSFQDLKQRYAPKSSDVDTLAAWLKEQGFKIIQIAPDGTGIYAQASTDQIAQNLQVKMVRVTKDGLTYTAAQNAPSLPAEVAQSLHAIIGLQPFRQAHKHNRKRLPKGGNRAPLPTAVFDGTLEPNIANALLT